MPYWDVALLGLAAWQGEFVILRPWIGEGNSMAERYNDTALHFDKSHIPKFWRQYLAPSAVSLADLGCGDGPWFRLLQREGCISPEQPVYAVDLEASRLARVKQRFSWIFTVVASADHVPEIPTSSLDWVISTMVMEHVPDEIKYLVEVSRILKPQGKAYITTVFKRTWAWYFRKRGGATVLDTSHLREYTNLESFQNLITRGSTLRIVALQLLPMWFPLLDPLLFRVGRYLALDNRALDLLRAVKVPIPGYYELHVILAKGNTAQ